MRERECQLRESGKREIKREDERGSTDMRERERKRGCEKVRTRNEKRIDREGRW